MRTVSVVACIAVMLSGGESLAGPAGQGTSDPTAPPVGAWPKPLILPIKLPPSPGSNEWTQLSIVVGKGLVGGSSEAVSSIGQPLSGGEGRSRALASCKKALWDQASQAGAESIEAVADAPDQRARGGKVFAPVTMRLAYVKPNMVEVKKSTAVCVVDRNGRFVDLYKPAPSATSASPSTADAPKGPNWLALTPGRTAAR